MADFSKIRKPQTPDQDYRLERLMEIKKHLDGVVSSFDSLSNDEIDDSIHTIQENMNYLGDILENEKDGHNKQIINTLKECITKNTSVNFELNSGEIFAIEPKIANKIIETHDELNEENQSKFRIMLVDSKESLTSILEFCNSIE